MNRYIIKFSKIGYIKYISHLDLLRLFKRSFKRVGIKLAYSQGFNPHPKMGFAQPLSLGYESSGEILEFETADAINEQELSEKMKKAMPEGIEILFCKAIKAEGKALAAITEFAEYRIKLPYMGTIKDEINVLDFIHQDKIIVQKLNKKKEMMDLDIKSMIKELAINDTGSELNIFAKLDAGSLSNLSPELLIKAIGAFYNLDYDRSEAEISRENIIFTNNLQF